MNRNARKIITDAEKDAFRSVIRYSFQSDWPDRLFPLRSGCEAWGLFDGEKLTAALIENRHTVRVFDRIVQLTGIGGVSSLPEYRNRGRVRELMAAALRSAASSGCAVSALYPFSFAFYEKLGYGNVGPEIELTFPPDALRFDCPEPGYSIVDLSGREGEAAEIADWYNGYFSGCDLSTFAETVTIAGFVRRAGSGSGYSKAAIDGDGRTAGLIVYGIERTGRYTQELSVERIAWRTPGGFRSLMWLLWTHRGQCAQVRMRMPDDRVITSALREPRTGRSVGHYWMARPLDVPGLLEARAAVSRFEGTAAFSLRDPCIEGNTGTYTVHGTAVSVSPFESAREIPFPVFSSLLFGRISIAQAMQAFDLPGEAASAESLFGPRAVHITEAF